MSLSLLRLARPCQQLRLFTSSAALSAKSNHVNKYAQSNKNAKRKKASEVRVKSKKALAAKEKKREQERRLEAAQAEKLPLNNAINVLKVTHKTLGLLLHLAGSRMHIFKLYAFSVHLYADGKRYCCPQRAV